jgi:hypothetical protein
MDEFIKLVHKEAEARHEAHKNHSSSRPLSENYETVGLLGEVEFAKKTGYMVDLERKLSGDEGVDFFVSVRMTVDVKTARKPSNLIHEAGKPFADIYVLAGYSEDGTVELIGWEFGSVLKKAPTKDFGYGIINHYIPAKDLRSIDKLIERVRL